VSTICHPDVAPMVHVPAISAPSAERSHVDYELRLRAIRRSDDPEGHRRLRLALKRLLRSFGLSCRSQRELEQVDTGDASPASS
jgi:hypothetical protein